MALGKFSSGKAIFAILGCGADFLIVGGGSVSKSEIEDLRAQVDTIRSLLSKQNTAS